jgi:CRISPR-associated exonuclease Cas4
VDIADYVPVAALQHWRYCQRQCALIHVEQVFAENVYTLRGQAVHARVDEPTVETRAGLRIERALPIWNERLGLIGKADCIEFEADGTAYPIEYKHGSRRKDPRIAACDELQLAAQALCLEEMTGHAVPEGALFYASSKRRRIVPITEALRADVESSVLEVRKLLAAGRMPPAVADERCRACSLIELCQPEALSADVRANALRAVLFEPDG